MILALALCGAAQAQDAEWLFVGNSYTGRNELAEWTALWLEDTVPAWSQVDATALTPGGYTLAEHLADATGATNLPLKQHLLTAPRPWTAVVLQEQSQIPGFSASDSTWQASRDAAVSLAILGGDTGAEVFLFNTWGRQQGDSQNPVIYPDYTTMQDRLDEGYATYRIACAAAGESVYVVPVGAAFRSIYEEEPSQFDELYATDGSHPSVLGTTIAAATFTATWSGRVPTQPTEIFGVGLSDEQIDLITDTVTRVVIDDPGPEMAWYHTYEDWPSADPVHGAARRPLVHVTKSTEGPALEVGDGRLWISADFTLPTLILGPDSELIWTSGILAVESVEGSLYLPEAGTLRIGTRTDVVGTLSGIGTVRWNGDKPDEDTVILSATTLDLSQITVELPQGQDWEVRGDELVLLPRAVAAPGHISNGCGCATGAGSPPLWIPWLGLLLLRRRPLW